MKKQREFKIESYDIQDKEILVDLQKCSISIPVTIPQDKFEWWLRVNNKLEWVFDISDHTGEHQQFNGTMSLGEYWATNTEYIHDDLYDYIVSHPIKYNGAIFTNSLVSIMLTFELHNDRRVEPMPFERWEHDQEIFNELLN